MEEPQTPAEPPVPDVPKRRFGWRRYVLGLPVGLVAATGALVLGLDTPIGHRLIIDVLAMQEFSGGLRVSIGRIEGSIYGRARLEGLVLRDPQGVFLRAGEGVLDWQPLLFTQKGLFIRQVVLRRGTLQRLPQLRDTDEAGSLWPDYDLRIDHFAVERLTLGKALTARLGGVERRIDLNGRLYLAKGVAQVMLHGKLGAEDRLNFQLDAHRAENLFAMQGEYRAPKGGLLAGLTGAQSSSQIRLGGRGTWDKWQSWLLAQQDARPAAALVLAQAGGAYRWGGRLWLDPLMPQALRHTLGGETLALGGRGHVDGKVISGEFRLGAAQAVLRGHGRVDLGKSRFEDLTLALTGGAHLPLGEDDALAGLSAQVHAQGPLTAPSLHFKAQAARWTSGDTAFNAMSAQGSLTRQGGVWRVPLELVAGQIVTADGLFDAQLKPVRATGTLAIAGSSITAPDLTFSIPKGSAKAVLRGDMAKGLYVVAGDAALRQWPLPVGAADAQGRVLVTVARGQPWRVGVDLRGVLPQFANPTLADLAGGAARFSARVEVAKGHVLNIANGLIEAPQLSLSLTGQRGASRALAVNAQGQQARYGSFSGAITYDDRGPAGEVRLQDPFPALGVKNVVLALSPEAEAIRISGRGESAFGPFTGQLGVSLPDSETARLDLRDFTFSSTHVIGTVDWRQGAADGRLTVYGGGVTGNVALTPRSGGQGIAAKLTAKNAHFDGDRPLTIAQGSLTASGLLQKQHSTLATDLTAQGVGKGKLFIGKLALGTKLNDGSGSFTASLGGRRGSRFDLSAAGEIAPNRISLLAGGSFAGQPIAMPRRAVLSADQRPEGLQWRLAPSQISVGSGRLLAQGVVGNGVLELGLGVADMPLALADVVAADLGLGGRATGQITYIQRREKAPDADAKLLIKGLTRSGLMQNSRAVDLAVVSHLRADGLDLRAVASDGSSVLGRVQGRIDRLVGDGMLADRLLHGRLVAQMRYGGPADALWRLMALQSFDLSGPIEIAADMTGSLDAPEIRGSLAGNALRLQSGQAGTDITGISARGNFSGSVLALTSLSGQTHGGGTVSGSGRLDFARMEGGRGPGIDITLAARRAQLLARPDMALVATGPIRILSDGLTGTIAGRLSIDSARWRLGQASAASALPALPTKEINRRADIAPAAEREMPWRLVVDAAGSGIRMQGLGLDSQWTADVQLRGALLEPAISGSASLVSGTYDFASKHFDLSRGKITFNGASPPDPQLDMAASATINNLTATVNVRGTAMRPQITFSSVPSLPEEELLARILFGDSISQISAPEAVQLGAALAALHGGGGLDPINKLRSAIGLDRLRFVSADAALGRQMGVAVGKYLGRRVYAEIVTDGRGYSATNLEFRLTNWLALLGSVASTGRQSVNAKVSKDY
ncbi:translocation/assembly module TamB [Novosphingobium umbonatum]|uniref:Translocation/assembly module TamB n=1 Tax=Novosphingobium umbonatum TaxID=1908524 RepID=A0A3S2UVU6_9SPHN|nr:translocation/assembly module TamB domain-containing protein [Novosphingobium umbonatum]RVU07635.1 translocation/assembly module TamB [Novosphingobium umbonatum]